MSYYIIIVFIPLSFFGPLLFWMKISAHLATKSVDTALDVQQDAEGNTRRDLKIWGKFKYTNFRSLKNLALAQYLADEQFC